MKKIIWALFDDGNGSWNKLDENKDYQIISIGINDNDWENYYKIDLSLNNFNLIKELSKLPKPDIIIASPPCESWSGADCGGSIWKRLESNLWELNNRDYYKNYNQECKPNKRRNFIKKEQNRIIGESTAGGVCMIIEHFKPKVWIIENPQTSKIWKFYKNHWNLIGIENIAHYSSYNQNFSKKPTNFMSNIELHLKRNGETGNREHMNSCYDNRSEIPKELLNDILNKIGDKNDR